MPSRAVIGLSVVLAAPGTANAAGGEALMVRFVVPERNLLIVDGECYTGGVTLEFRSADSTLVVNDTQIVRKPPRDRAIIERERGWRLGVESVREAVDRGADPDQIIAEAKQREKEFSTELFRTLNAYPTENHEQVLARLFDEYRDVVAELGVPEPGREFPSRAYYRFHWMEARVEVAEQPKHPSPSLHELWSGRLRRIRGHLTREYDDVRVYVILRYTSTSYGTSRDPDFDKIVQSATGERY